MFCPSCGIDEKQPNQFCRGCGVNLQAVRASIEHPDDVTQSAVTSRMEIGRARAARIRETESVRELKKVAEDVLPGVEKFLESPEEKRLRRLRTATIISSVGLGVGVALTLVAILQRNTEMLFLAGLGGIVFFLGLGFFLNAFFFTVPKKSISGKTERFNSLDDAAASGLKLADPGPWFSSVTENTTQHLHEKEPINGR